jgi:hypothetical protein
MPLLRLQEMKANNCGMGKYPAVLICHALLLRGTRLRRLELDRVELSKDLISVFKSSIGANPMSLEYLSFAGVKAP